MLAEIASTGWLHDLMAGPIGPVIAIAAAWLFFGALLKLLD